MVGCRWLVCTKLLKTTSGYHLLPFIFVCGVSCWLKWKLRNSSTSWVWLRMLTSYLSFISLMLNKWHGKVLFIYSNLSYHCVPLPVSLSWLISVLSYRWQPSDVAAWERLHDGVSLLLRGRWNVLTVTNWCLRHLSKAMLISSCIECSEQRFWKKICDENA